MVKECSLNVLETFEMCWGLLFNAICGQFLWTFLVPSIVIEWSVLMSIRSVSYLGFWRTYSKMTYNYPSLWKIKLLCHSLSWWWLGLNASNCTISLARRRSLAGFDKAAPWEDPMWLRLTTSYKMMVTSS